MTEDAIRTTVIMIGRSLAKLQLRLLQLHWSAADKHLLTVRDVKPPSRWIDGAAEHTSLSGIIDRVATSQAHLWALLASNEPIDARQVARIIHHIPSGIAWGEMTLRTAAHLGVPLAATPKDELHGGTILNDVLAGR